MRIALAGYAYGRTLHGPLIKKAGGQVVAVATSNPERAAQAEQDWPGVEVAPDLTALLEFAPRLEVDAIVLATPTGDHAEHVRQVLEAGLACVCDKPLTVDAESSAELVELSRRRGVPLTVFHNRRWDSGPVALRAAVEAGVLGELRRFEFRWERWRPEPKKRWREEASWRDGGGVLLDLGAHIIDTAVQFLGPVTSVYAQVQSLTTPADDDVWLTCRHGENAVSVLTASSFVPAAGPRLRAVGTTAGYLFDGDPDGGSFPDLADAPGAAGWIVAGEERRPAELPASYAEHGDAEFYVRLRRALEIDAADYEGRQAAMPVDPADAVHVARVMDAARVSSDENRVVPIDAAERGGPELRAAVPVR